MPVRLATDYPLIVHALSTLCLVDSCQPIRFDRLPITSGVLLDRHLVVVFLLGLSHSVYTAAECRPAVMSISDIVTDPALLPVLRTSAEIQTQCQQLLSLLDPTGEVASGEEGTESPALAASRQQKQVFALLARLRGQDREAIFRVRDTKQATAEARQEIDRLHLQLQNLYYEQRHLTGEIAACESYEYVMGPWCLESRENELTTCSHKYLSLPLIPVEEFLAVHPEYKESDEHDLMIARINHEHAEREKLEQARQELLKRKQALIAENKKRKDGLANLDQDLERFIDVCLLSRLVPSDLANDDRLPNRSRRPLKRSINWHIAWLEHGA